MSLDYLFIFRFAFTLTWNGVYMRIKSRSRILSSIKLFRQCFVSNSWLIPCYIIIHFHYLNHIETRDYIQDVTNHRQTMNLKLGSVWKIVPLSTTLKRKTRTSAHKFAFQTVTFSAFPLFVNEGILQLYQDSACHGYID